jgi:L1 cell adhesion molecule like protein
LNFGVWTSKTIKNILKIIKGRNFEDKELPGDIYNFSYKVINDSGRPQIEIDLKEIKKFLPEEIYVKNI